MKKLFLLFLIITSFAVSYGAVLTGNVRIDPAAFAGKDSANGAENYGVLVFAEENGIYDITDGEGNFTLKDLAAGKEYTLVFQKKGIKDYKEKVKISRETQNITINIKARTGIVRIVEGKEVFSEVVKYKTEKKYQVKGIVKSKGSGDVFINFKNKGYGIIARPNVEFSVALDKGEYAGEITQDGAYSKNISFKVGGEESTNIGTIELEGKVFGNINIAFNQGMQDSYIYIYKEDVLKFSQKIERGRESIRIPDLKQGNYKIVVKSEGYKDYSKSFFLKEEYNLRIDAEKGKGKENDPRIFVTLYPENTDTEITLTDADDKTVKKENGLRDIYIIDTTGFRGPFKLSAKAEGYKNQEVKEIKSGERVDFFLEKERDTIIITGTIYPFSNKTEVEMLGTYGKVKAVTDNNGNYELKLDAKEKGKKFLRVYGDGYEEKFVTINIEEGRDVKNLNIELKPLFTSINGNVKLEGGEDNGGVTVIIEELNLWTVTGNDGIFNFPNIAEGKYNILFRKFGYNDKREKVTIERDKSREIEAKLIPYATIVIRGNIEGYKFVIEELDGKKEIVKGSAETSTFTKQMALGKKKITVDKDGYRSAGTVIELNAPGEIKEIKIELEDMFSYKVELSNRIEETKKMIENLEIEKAEKNLFEIKRIKKSPNYKGEIGNAEEKKIADLDDKLQKAKRKLYDGDNAVRAKLKEVRESVKEIEEQDLGYSKKRELLDERYKEAIDYIEKILTEYYYTTLKYDVYTLQGDVYMKLGMTNSAQKSYENAKKYK